MSIDLAGEWAMNHDGWRGTLVIYPSDQRLVGIEGVLWWSCTYTTRHFSGTYTGNDGVPLHVVGDLGGKDLDRRTGERCKQSEHQICFSVPFAADAPQFFKGYVFTHQPNLMAGYTWWQQMPFGWYATRK